VNDSRDRRPGEWPVPRSFPHDPGFRSEFRVARPHGEVPPGPAAPPVVVLHVTVDLTGARDAGAVHDLVREHLAFDTSGAHVHVVLGPAAAHDPSLPRTVAGRTMGAAAVHVSAAPGVRPGAARLFVTELIRHSRDVLADHHQMLRELRSSA
jgi:hypothetical protein